MTALPSVDCSFCGHRSSYFRAAVRGRIKCDGEAQAAICEDCVLTVTDMFLQRYEAIEIGEREYSSWVSAGSDTAPTGDRHG